MIFGRSRVGRSRVGVAVAIVTGLLLVGCSGSNSTKSASTSSASSGTSSGSSSAPGTSAVSSMFPAQPGAPAQQYYVSIGDSYAAGFQPTAGTGQGATTRNGFAYQAVTEAKAKGYDYQLVNFGCSGATTESVLKTVGCPASRLGPSAASYDTMTQAAAAEAFLSTHQGQVGLITVVIGGNDIVPCGAATDTVSCLGTALSTVGSNLKTLLAGLRAAAGPQTRIVGVTYPDVLLGEALSKDAARQAAAKLSVLAFQSLINPQFKTAYEAVAGRFVDVTAATGGYGPLTDTTTLAPYGTIPVPVAKICELTFFCQLQDIHPRTVGYALIARLVVATLPQH